MTRNDERVPCKAVAPVILEWLKDYTAKVGEGTNGYCEYGTDGFLERLAADAGTSARTLRRIVNGRVDSTLQHNGKRQKVFVDYISLTLADKIVTAAVGPQAWHEEPLASYYGPFEVTERERRAGFEMPVDDYEIAA